MRESPLRSATCTKLDHSYNMGLLPTPSEVLRKRAPSKATILEKRSRESAVLRNARLQEGAVLRIRASRKVYVQFREARSLESGDF